MARMTQEEFDSNLKTVEESFPLVFEFIADFVSKEVDYYCALPTVQARMNYLEKRYGGTV